MNIAHNHKEEKNLIIYYKAKISPQRKDFVLFFVNLDNNNEGNKQIFGRIVKL